MKSKIKKIILFAGLMFSFLGFGQTEPSLAYLADAIKFRKATTAIRNQYVVPSGELWVIGNEDTDVLEWWNGSAWVVVGGSGGTADGNDFTTGATLTGQTVNFTVPNQSGYSLNLDAFALDSDLSSYRLLINNNFTGTVTATGQFRVNGSVDGYASMYAGNFQIVSTDDTNTLTIGNREGVDISGRIGFRPKGNWSNGVLEFDWADDRWEVDNSPIITAANAAANGIVSGTDDQTGAEISLTGYSKGSDDSAILPTDTVNEGLAKVENQIETAVLGAGGLTAQQTEELANITAGVIKKITIDGDVILSNENYNPSTAPYRGAKVWNLIDGNHTITVPSTSSLKSGIFIAPDSGTVTFESDGPEFKIAGESNVFGFELANGESCSLTRLDANRIQVHGVVTATAYTVADTTPPSVPTGLASGANDDTTVDLAWNASTDDTAVTQYRYRVDGGTPVVLGNVLSTTVTGLTASTAYDFEIAAGDAEDNWSTYSSAITVTTDAAASTYGTNPNPNSGTELQPFLFGGASPANAGAFQPDEANSIAGSAGGTIGAILSSVADTSNGYGDYVMRITPDNASGRAIIRRYGQPSNTIYEVYVLYKGSGLGELKFGGDFVTPVRITNMDAGSFTNTTGSATLVGVTNGWTLIKMEVQQKPANNTWQLDIYPDTTGSNNPMDVKVSIKIKD